MSKPGFGENAEHILNAICWISPESGKGYTDDLMEWVLNT